MSRLLAFMLFLLPAAAYGQSFAGEWTHEGAAGTVRLALVQEGQSIRGSMVGADGTTFSVQGTIEDGIATGLLQVGTGTGWFRLGFLGEKLGMVVAEIDSTTGQPDLSNGWELDFSRTAAAPQAPGANASRNAPPAGSAPAGTAARPGAVPPQSEASPLVREWLGHLRGKRLSYRDSYNSNDSRGFGGYSERWDAFLCSDGTFYFQQRSRVSIDTGGATGSSGGDTTARGLWRIAEANGAVYLQYQMEGSEGEQAMLRFENGSTYLDRNRIFVTDENPHCR
jgi:hypothetical protein